LRVCAFINAKRPLVCHCSHSPVLVECLE
jgi:hypothetical protein